ncbi:MAG: hypothetical protein KAU31_14110, partial [Spirochaetaceae bacterium]|nr:hypothetical protein [Spirochaetaceae bacterium]
NRIGLGAGSVNCAYRVARCIAVVFKAVRREPLFAHLADLVFLAARAPGVDEILQQFVEIFSEHGRSVASVGVGANYPGRMISVNP